MRDFIRLLFACTTTASAVLAGVPIPTVDTRPGSLIGSFEDRSAPSTYQYDAPPYVGWFGSSGEYVGVNAFSAVGGSDMLTSISCVWRADPNGSTQRVFIWQDDGSGDIRNARLVAQQSVTVANTDTATVNVYSLTKPVAVSGRFYVGFSSLYTGGTSVLAYQYVGGPAYVAGRSYIGVSTPPFDAANFGEMPFPFTDVSLVSGSGYFGIRANGSGSSFVYQGRLTSSGTNYSGPADFRFTIFDSKTDGAVVSPVFEQRNIDVSGGVFSLQIPSDPSVFANAPDRYLQVEVRTPAGSGDFTPLTPRERIGQVPAAMVATLAQSAQSVPWSGLSGVPANLTAWNSVPGGIGYSEGRVGIGTAAPMAALHVSGGPLYRNLDVDSSNQEGTWFNLTNTGSNGKQWSLISTGSINMEGAGALLIRDSSASAVRAAFLPNGNVGIGTATPTATLDVNGSIATNGPIVFGNRLDDLVILNGTPGGPNFALGIAQSTLRIHTAISSQFISFGYGSASAYTQTASITGGGSLTIIGNGFKPGGGSWAASCDPRLKHDIAPMAGTLDRLLSLRGYQFVYNDDAVRSNKGLPGVQIGLMADEVERVFPDWVTRDEDGMRMVTERSTTALVVEALRDLRDEKDRQIEAQKREIEDLKARLERLERSLETSGR